jgi:hypothetical protein
VADVASDAGLKAVGDRQRRPARLGLAMTTVVATPVSSRCQTLLLSRMRTFHAIQLRIFSTC